MSFDKEIHPQLEPLLKELEASTPYSVENLEGLDINSGAYVFYDGNKAMCVGIVGPHSKQSIQTRIKQHSAGKPRVAPLASLMTIEALGFTPMTMTRKVLLQDHHAKFKEKQSEVCNMKVRAIEIKCCVTLAAFEIYAAVTLMTPYNDFCTH